jgi:hypothetical protein
MASTSTKRKAEAAEAPATKKKAADGLVNSQRWRALNEGAPGPGPVIYWCAAPPRRACCAAGRALPASRSARAPPPARPA